MLRMGRSIWVIVSACFREALSGAAIPLVDMEGEESAGAVSWQTGYVGHDQDTVGFLKKFDFTHQRLVVLTTGDVCDGVRIQGVRIHQITSRQFMPRIRLW